MRKPKIPYDDPDGRWGHLSQYGCMVINSLLNGGYSSLAEAQKAKDEELLSCYQLGKKSLALIRRGSLQSGLEYELSKHKLKIYCSGEKTIVGECSCGFYRRVGKHTAAGAISIIHKEHASKIHRDQYFK